MHICFELIFFCLFGPNGIFSFCLGIAVIIETCTIVLYYTIYLSNDVRVCYLCNIIFTPKLSAHLFLLYVRETVNPPIYTRTLSAIDNFVMYQ